MTTKRALMAIGGVVAGLGLLVLIFVVAIFAISSYQISNSDAAARAKQFLRTNEKLKQDIGEVKGFGRFAGGRIDVATGSGEATIDLKVEGDRQTVAASVKLIFLYGNTWRVSSASYVNARGEKISLLDPYDTKLLIPLLSA